MSLKVLRKQALNVAAHLPEKQARIVRELAEASRHLEQRALMAEDVATSLSISRRMRTYRKVTDITEQEFLDALTPEPQYQVEIFVKLGGDPNDHHYALLSHLTQSLRRKGHDIRTSRRLGVWLG